MIDHVEPDSSPESAAQAILVRYIHDTCMNIELAIESDALESPDWYRLRRQLSHIASIAGLFDKPELGNLARELENELDLLSPGARIGRLMNARYEFARLAASR